MIIFSMEFLKGLLFFLKTRKKFWLLPVMVILLFLALFVILTAGSAPGSFFYTLF
jgi:hypothetical protein